ncbi:MAG: hypothetical protein H0T79_10730 [Deltaproteobacteria bacterium]|nr:hypothetical protein [Deltaproteobacteria bacterium]
MPRLLILVASGACGACGDPEPKPAPATKQPDARWTEVRSAPFMVQMPGTATPGPDGLVYRDGAITYALVVDAVPGYLVAQPPATINGHYAKRRAIAGTMIASGTTKIDGRAVFRQHVGNTGGDVYVAHLPFGRWHAQLTVSFPRHHDEPRTAERFIRSLRVTSVEPESGVWECDALLADLCETCGPTSPACARQLVAGTRDACAVESALTFNAVIRQMRCGDITKRGTLDLTGMKDSDARSITITEDGVSLGGTVDSVTPAD